MRQSKGHRLCGGSIIRAYSQISTSARVLAMYVSLANDRGVISAYICHGNRGSITDHAIITLSC